MAKIGTPKNPLPNKRLTRRRRGKPTRYFHSLKTGMSHWCESNLEMDHLLLLEFDQKVLDFRSQPGSAVYYSHGERKFRYTPDVWVRYENSIEYREVKPRVFANEKFEKKISFLNELFQKKYACELRTVLDDEIRLGDTISNLWRLYPYQRVSLSKPEIERFRMRLPSQVTLGELRESAAESELSPTVPFALLAKRHLVFDVTKSLTHHSLLWLPQ